MVGLHTQMPIVFPDTDMGTLTAELSSLYIAPYSECCS